MFWEIEAEPIWTSVENFPIRSIFQVNEKYKKKVSKSVKLISKFAKRTHTHIHTHTHTHTQDQNADNERSQITHSTEML